MTRWPNFFVIGAGKSGTTQVVSLDLVEGLEPEEIPVRYRDHALFAQVE